MKIIKVYETFNTIYYCSISDDATVTEFSISISDDALIIVRPDIICVPEMVVRQALDKLQVLAQTKIKEIILLIELDYQVPNHLKCWINRGNFPEGECPMYDLLHNKMTKLVRRKNKQKENAEFTWDNYCSKQLSDIERNGDLTRMQMMIDHYNECLPMSKKWMKMSDKQKRASLDQQLDDYFGRS